MRDARAWRAAQTIVAMPSLPHIVVSPSCLLVVDSVVWTSFSDAVWDPATGNCGLGWLLRDSKNSMAECSSSNRWSDLFLWFWWPKFWQLKLQFRLQSLLMLAGFVLTLTPKIWFCSWRLKDRSGSSRSAARHSCHVSLARLYLLCLANVQADSMTKAALYSLSSLASVVDWNLLSNLWVFVKKKN